MEITQDKVTFQPITIKLNTREEADNFFGIIDYLDHEHVDNLSEGQKALLVELSNAVTLMDVVI